MSYEKRVREHRQILKKLLSSLNATLESPPNVIANNKLIVISAIVEKALMLFDEAIRAASLQPKEVEEILDQYAKDSANYGNNPAID